MSGRIKRTATSDSTLSIKLPDDIACTVHLNNVCGVCYASVSLGGDNDV